MKKVKILEVNIAQYNNNTVRINYTIDINGETQTLWYEVSDKYAQYICDDRCDCALVSIFATAMYFGFDVIESELPVSEKLYYNLTYYVIPQLSIADNGKYPKLKIVAPKITKKYNGKAVGAGFSRGVDSFNTLYEYSDSFELKDYQITHFTYNNIGAHHGKDVEVGNSPYSHRELYEGQLEGTKQFCEQYGYELLDVDSNLNDFLRDSFGHLSFFVTHIYRNLGVPLLLQKLFGKFYYSSTRNLNYFNISFKTDMAEYEKWVIPYLNTENIEFYNANQEWTRFKKTQHVTTMEESYDYLQVCLVGIKNCGKCVKCRKTLMTLDVLGSIDKYKNSFDIERYKAEDREKWFAQIYEFKRGVGPQADDYREIYNYGVAHNFPYIKEPELKKVYEKNTIGRIRYERHNIRALPSKSAALVLCAKKDQPFICIGKAADGWMKISNYEVTGFIAAYGIEMITPIIYHNEKKAKIVEPVCDLYELPTKFSSAVMTMKDGDEVILKRKLDSWYLAQTVDGKTGYISHECIQIHSELKAADNTESE